MQRPHVLTLTALSLAASLALADVGPGPRPMPPAPPSVVQTPIARFTNRARQAGFQFQWPNGFREAAVSANRDMLYDYAVSDADHRVEVRYALRPIAQADLQRYRDYVAHRSPAGTVVTDPNKRGNAELMAIALNVSGGNLKPAQPLDAQMARELFGADGAQATTLPVAKSQFATGWKNVMIVQFWKRDVGYAYVFFLYNDSRDLPAEGFAHPAIRALHVAPVDQPVPQLQPIPPT